jgi:hypothetical protein
MVARGAADAPKLIDASKQRGPSFSAGLKKSFPIAKEGASNFFSNSPNSGVS